MLRTFYATHELAGHKKGSVIVVDDTDPHGWGLVQSGYFAEIVEPEGQPDGEQGSDRTGS